MAELSQIIGAVFRDFTQARVGSDLYSRDVSRYYEQDSLLRKFPVPRTEVDEFELTLHFVVAQLEDDPEMGAVTEASSATVFTRHSFRIAGRIFDIAVAAFQAQPKLAEELTRTTHRITLQQDILRYLQRSQATLINEKHELNTAAVEQAIQERGLELLGKIREKLEIPESAISDDALAELGKALATLVNELGQELQQVLTEGAKRVHVSIEANELRDIPPEVLSNIKIKGSVKNYIWTQIDVRDGNVWRSLSPE